MRCRLRNCQLAFSLLFWTPPFLVETGDTGFTDGLRDLLCLYEFPDQLFNERRIHTLIPVIGVSSD